MGTIEHKLHSFICASHKVDGELFVVFQGSLKLCQSLPNTVDGHSQWFGHHMNDLLLTELFEFFHRFNAQELEDLSRPVVIVKEHVQLFFLCDERTPKRYFFF